MGHGPMIDDKVHSSLFLLQFPFFFFFFHFACLFVSQTNLELNFKRFFSSLVVLSYGFRFILFCFLAIFCQSNGKLEVFFCGDLAGCVPFGSYSS